MSSVESERFKNNSSIQFLTCRCTMLAEELYGHSWFLKKCPDFETCPDFLCWLAYSCEFNVLCLWERADIDPHRSETPFTDLHQNWHEWWGCSGHCWCKFFSYWVTRGGPTHTWIIILCEFFILLLFVSCNRVQFKRLGQYWQTMLSEARKFLLGISLHSLWDWDVLAPRGKDANVS